MCILGDVLVLSKLVLLKRIPDGSLGAELPVAGGYGSLGAKPPAAGQFFVTFWKNAVLKPLDHISHVFRAS